MENDERVATARDPVRRVAWLVRSYPWRLDLRRAFDLDLRADLKCETRAIFAANAEDASAPGPQAPQTSARTADPEWSPIVDLERVQLGEAEALRLVWRSLGDAPVRLLDVWRLPDRIAGRDRERQLLALAKQIVADWAAEGATDIRQAPRLVPGDGPSVGAENLVHFTTRGGPRVSAMRFRVDDDGCVFRVSAGAAPHVSPAVLMDRCVAVMSSLRRLDAGSTTSEVPAARPWWRLW